MCFGIGFSCQSLFFIIIQNNKTKATTFTRNFLIIINDDVHASVFAEVVFMRKEKNANQISKRNTNS